MRVHPGWRKLKIQRRLFFQAPRIKTPNRRHQTASFGLTARSQQVAIKEQPGATCKKITGQLTIEQNSEQQLANSEELYCEAADGSWSQVSGTVL
jgi:hypothetical protein